MFNYVPDPASMPDTSRTTKGERTRARILDAALELFRERGYEGTTMREVASGAGVSVGNAYYYFESKEHLIQGFYARTHAEHLAACRPRLARTRGLRRRLEAVLETKVESAEPYHAVSAHLFKIAADPASPLNPFSSQSAPTRDEAIALMAEVVDGSSARVHPDLRAELPRLLWLLLMAVILYWIHDDSPGRARTHRLIGHVGALVPKLVTVASLPLMGAVRKASLRMLADLTPPGPEAAA